MISVHLFQWVLNWSCGMNTSTLSLHSFHCLHRDDLFFVLILSSFLSHNNYLRVFFLFFCYINNCSTRCNTKQPIYYSASSFYMFRVSTTPIIRSTQNCNYSLRYCAATSLQPGQASLVTLEGGRCTKNMTSTEGFSYSFVYSWWWVWLTHETCRVNLQNNK